MLAESDTDCGSCGNACTGGAVCENGSCVASCMPPSTSCYGTCTNLVDSPRHCGGCDTFCGPGNYQTAVCANAACVYTAVPCPPGQTLCSGPGCVDLTSDASHCGACDKGCGFADDRGDAAAMCVNGSCACPPGLTWCPHGCVDLSRSLTDCGACDAAPCAADQTCVNGACAAIPTLATGLVVDDMAVDDTSIYFVSTSAGTVNVMPAAGGAPVALASGLAKPLHLALDAQYVYYSLNLGGGVMRVPKAGGAPTVVGAANQPTALLVDGQNAYWADNNSISAAPKAGGATTVLATTSGGATQSPVLAQNSQFIIYSLGGRLWRVAKTGIGGTELILDHSGNTLSALLADETYIYFNEWVPLGQPPWYVWFPLRAVPIPGISAPSFDLWAKPLGPLVWDQSGTYGGGGGGILKLGLCPNAQVQRLISLPKTTLLALDSTYVYWSDGTSIGRVPK